MGALSTMRAWFGGGSARAETAADLIPARYGQRSGGMPVSNETAMRNSVVWACLRLRADLVSNMPVDVYRKVNGIRVTVTTVPPVLVSPGGERIGIREWMYSTQIDLDRAGNAFGIISQRNALGLPLRIDLVNLADVTVRCRGSVITEIRIGNQEFSEAKGNLRDIWHERQYTVAGLPMGLSPVAHAAWSLEEGFGAQKFALDWFAGSAIPMAELKNVGKTLTANEARIAKDAYRAAVSAGDLFVHGRDWEFKPIQAVASQSEFLASRGFSYLDITRFFGCPADTVDVATSTGSITYASITQRNLQFLIMHLDPALGRREDALTTLTPRPWYVKLNRGSLLAMDPATRATVLKTRIDSRTLTPDEARALEDLPPLTDAQYEEFKKAFAGGASSAPVQEPNAADAPDASAQPTEVPA